MEDNKKKPLGEEELEQVSGGSTGVGTHIDWFHDGADGGLLISDGVNFKCQYCGETFKTHEELLKHQANCFVPSHL